MKELIKLSSKKFQEIYTNEEFRNQVAFAHGCYDSNSVFKHLKTCSYPVEYIVTEAQKQTAEIERQRAKTQTVKDNEGKLMLVGMGCTYAPRYEDDVCNHRVRTEFVNAKGHKFFIEAGTGRGEDMRIDYAIDRENGREDASSEGAYNYNNLERSDSLPKYTKRNLLNLVNSEFGCAFTEIVIDNYNVSTDDYTAVSPKAFQLELSY